MTMKPLKSVKTASGAWWSQGASSLMGMCRAAAGYDVKGHAEAVGAAARAGNRCDGGLWESGEASRGVR